MYVVAVVVEHLDAAMQCKCRIFKTRHRSICYSLAICINWNLCSSSQSFSAKGFQSESQKSSTFVHLTATLMWIVDLLSYIVTELDSITIAT
jgi:hypothetical protein